MPPKKNKKPPAALRHEVEEYTSLLRTLHVSSTQDIVPHLTGLFPPPEPVSSRKREATPSPSRRGISNDKRATTPPDSVDEEMRGSASSSSSKQKGSQTNPGSRTKSIWTIWPLLKEDVYAPEWSLAEEVNAIAEKAMSRWMNEHIQEDSNSLGDEEEEDENESFNKDGEGSNEDSSKENSSDEDEKNANLAKEEEGSVQEDERPLGQYTESELDETLPEDVLTRPVLDALTLSTSNLLEGIFAALAAHRPAVNITLQNRLGRMDWQMVLQIISSTELVNPQVLEDAKKRMERIFGSAHDLHVRERKTAKERGKRKFAELEDSLGDRLSLFSFAKDPRQAKRPRNLQ